MIRAKKAAGLGKAKKAANEAAVVSVIRALPPRRLHAVQINAVVRLVPVAIHLKRNVDALDGVRAWAVIAVYVKFLAVESD